MVEAEEDHWPPGSLSNGEAIKQLAEKKKQSARL